MEKLVWRKFILGLGNIDTALQKGLGGVIFFSKDIESEFQFKSLINDLKLKSKSPLFLSIDQEGGRVERTEKIRSKRLSAKYAFEKGLNFLEKQSEEISNELQEYGINLNFAPCIDVNSNLKNPIIGERAFSSNADDVISGGEVFINSSRKYNIIPCIKHFPGHGDADKDSHLTLPKIDLSLEEMEEVHIKPFKYFIKKGIEMIMVAHLHCSCFNKEPIPTSLSENAISYLRNDLGYNGVVISDDMFMKGVQDFGSLEAVLMAIRAGVDMFIFRDADIDTLKMIDKLVKIVESDKELIELVQQSEQRIAKLRDKIS